MYLIALVALIGCEFNATHERTGDTAVAHAHSPAGS
jgi:uncharacterized BrkB/YihY/UPF0761 family membrane protein